MAIIRPVYLMPPERRHSTPLQVPNTGRSALADGTFSWYFVAPVTATTPHYTWTLSASQPAQIWDIATQASDGTNGLDLLNHAYLVFCLDNTDQLYAVRQDQWSAVTNASDLCPIAWVDYHHDLIPRMSGAPAIIVQYIVQDGAFGSGSHYGNNRDGAVAYPNPSEPAPGVVGTVYTQVSQNRLAMRHGSVLILLDDGRLAYLSDPRDLTTTATVTLPALDSPHVTPRCLGINANPLTDTWWALVEYDANVTDGTYRGLYVFESTVQAVSGGSDWTLSYTILDQHTNPTPTFTPGLLAANATTAALSAPLSAVSGFSVFEGGSSFGQAFSSFQVQYDATTWILQAINVIHTISVVLPSGAVHTYTPSTINFPGTVAAGTYVLCADPTLGLQLVAGGVPASGTSAVLTITVTNRINTTYTRAQGSFDTYFNVPVTVSSPQTFPSPTSMTFGEFHRPDYTAGGAFISDPGNLIVHAGEYTGNLIGVQTDDISMSTTASATSPLAYNFFSFAAQGLERTDGTSNFGRLIQRNGASTINPFDGIQRPTVLPHTNGYNFLNRPMQGVNGPTISATATIGSSSGGTPPVPQALGIGPSGETLVNVDTAGVTQWQYWRWSGAAFIKANTTYVPETGVQYLPTIFGLGIPSPLTTEGQIIDATGVIDTAPAVIAYQNPATDHTYAVYADGSLHVRLGPHGTPWTLITAAMVDPANGPPFQPLALQVQTDLTIAFLYGAGGQLYMAIYDPVADAVKTSVGTSFPTFESSASPYGLGVFLLDPLTPIFPPPPGP